jgi:uncharacterized protein (DUF1501 family)
MMPDRSSLPGCSRRDFVRLGGLSTLLLSAPWARALPPARARSCILIWLDGGPSHLETFDPKPDAPAEVRGPLGVVRSSVPGIVLSDALPRIATRLDRVTLIRSVTSPLGEHNFGTHYLLTGYRPTPALEYPVVGSVVAHLDRGPRVLPAHVAVPDFKVGGTRLSGHGFLPAQCAPFALAADPAAAGARVAALDFFPGIDAARLARRRSFLADLDRLDRAADASSAPDDDALAAAYRLTISPAAKAAFDLAQEPAAVRQRFGLRTIGQSCLLARRLVERGVRFVTVNHAGWDTHDRLFTRLKEGYTGATEPVGLAPLLDQAVAALLDDLAERGLLHETLVLVMGEFGRTPKLNTAAGRDHWPRVFSTLWAGGGVPAGQVIGASDAVGESPRDREVTPADLAASLYTLLGIDPASWLHTSDGRPVPLVTDGRPLPELVGCTAARAPLRLTPPPDGP